MVNGLTLSNRPCLPRAAARWCFAVATDAVSHARHLRLSTAGRNRPAGALSCRRHSFVVATGHRPARLRGKCPPSGSASAEIVFALLSSGQRTAPSAGHALHKEIALGSAIGLAAALAGAWMLGGSPLVFTFATVSGSTIGALIGLLIWIGSDVKPEDAVLPPAPGDARAVKLGRPRRRA